MAEDQIFHLHRHSSLLLQHCRKFDCAVLFFVGKWTTDGPLCMTSDYDAGMTMSVVYAKHAPMTDSSTTVSAAVTITHNVSTTEVSTDATPLPTTATPAPPKDIWTVSYQNTSFKCILLSAHIILTYNNNGEVISVVMLLLLFVFCLLPVLFLLACSNDVEIVFFLTFDYRKEIVDYFSIIVFRVGIWNVDSLTGRLGELVEALAERRMDVLCVQETRWRSDCRLFGAIRKRYKLFLMGYEAKTDGVGIFVAEK